MRRRDVTSFRDKRRKGTSRLEEEFLSAVESARFRIGGNEEKKRGREEKRIPWKTPRNWQSNKRSQEKSTATDRFETAFSS